MFLDGIEGLGAILNCAIVNFNSTFDMFLKHTLQFFSVSVHPATSSDFNNQNHQQEREELKQQQ